MSERRLLLKPWQWALLGSTIAAVVGCNIWPGGALPIAPGEAARSSFPAPRATATADIAPQPTPYMALSPSASLVVPTPTSSPTKVPTATPTPLPSPVILPTIPSLSLAEREQIFEEVWYTVKEHYLYADFNGVDWDALLETYRPLVQDADNREAFYDLMVELVSQLDDHHSRFVPPAAALVEDTTSNGQDIMVGIGVLTHPKADGAFVQIVIPNSPADRAGLQPRDRIIGVDGRSYRLEDGDLLGEQGSLVRLTVVRPGEKPRDVVIERQEVRYSITPSYRRFPGDIGYVSIPTLWVNDMHEQVSGALTELVAAGRLRGLILDVRANPGGWGGVLSGVLSHFVRGQVGMFFDRHRVRPLVVNTPAGPDLRGVPLVVLVDDDTASYAEVLAAILQREGKALIVGTRSAGNTETIYAHTMIDGSRLWLAQEGFRLQDGVELEGQGVEPDSMVDVDWTHYSEEDDPQLLEALRLLGAGPK